MITLLSYPRSGNHFVRFIIEFISKKPTRGCNDPSDTYISKKPFKNSKLLSHVNINEDPIVAKSHYSTPHLDHHPEATTKLIFIIRNFTECITNHLGGKILINKEGGLKYYMSLLEFYDNFNGPKMIIYYEELIKNPADIALRLYKFLELTDDTYLNIFESKTQEIVTDSIQCEQPIPCYLNESKNQLIFHSKKLSEKEIKQTKTYITENYPTLLSYLEEYI